MRVKCIRCGRAYSTAWESGDRICSRCWSARQWLPGLVVVVLIVLLSWLARTAWGLSPETPPPIPIDCDAVEINSVFNRDGRLVLDQLIVWHDGWARSWCRHGRRDTRFPQEDAEHWPEGEAKRTLAAVGIWCGRVPKRRGDRWEVECVGRDQRRYLVRGKFYLRSWTYHDPEVRWRMDHREQVFYAGW